MTTRQRVRVGLLAAVAAALAAELYTLRPDSGPTPIYRQADYDRVQVGMTSEDVEKLLGKGPGFIPEGFTMTPSQIGPRPGNRGSTWFGRDMVVQVWFSDNTNRVTSKEFRPVIRVPQKKFSLYDWLRRWLPL